MNSLKKLLEKIKGNKTLLIGMIILIPVVIFVISVIIGGILIFGLNLMGFAIPYTLKTIIGAAIVVASLRPMGTSKDS